jgi:hypothetical protein
LAKVLTGPLLATGPASESCNLMWHDLSD